MSQVEGFNYDNMFIRMLSRMADCMLLSLFFCLFSLPVITIGPALAALNYTAMKGIELDGGYVWKYFTKSFKSNFKQGILMWLIFALAFFVFGVDIWYWWSLWKQSALSAAKPFIAIAVILLTLAVMMFVYSFAMLAKFENTTKGILKNSLLIAVRYFPQTLLILLMLAVAVWFLYYTPVIAVIVFPLMGFGLLGYAIAYFMLKAFAPYLPKEETHASDEEFCIEEAEAEEIKTAEEPDGTETAEAEAAGKPENARTAEEPQEKH